MAKSKKQQEFIRVGENLRRCKQSGIYEAFFKVGGKQRRFSLKTKDPALARRRLADKKRMVGRLTTTDARKMPFAEYAAAGKTIIGGLAKTWLDAYKIRWKPLVEKRENYVVKELARHFGHLTVRNITTTTVETWATQRAATCAPATFNRERLRLRQIFAYAVKHGIILDNPAADIPKLKVIKREPRIPTPSEFAAILRTMRSATGKRDGKDSANLLEGLAYLGCRQEDAYWLQWQHIDFDAETVTVTGHPDTGTKNGEQRPVPLFAPFARLLTDMRAALPTPPAPTDRVFQVKSCRKSFENALRTLNLPAYPPHHTWRRFFISHCLMAHCDVKSIAKWVGHKDGGVLILRTYSFLYDEHNKDEAKKVTFDADATGTSTAPTTPTPNNIIPFPLPTAMNS